jgi:hypothetical protein
MNDAAEVALLVALQQFANATNVFLTKASVGTTNIWAKTACAVGAQLAANVATGAKAAVAAANAEFTTSNAAEKTFVTSLATLPPIS